MKNTFLLLPLLTALLQFVSSGSAHAFGGSPGGPFSNTSSYFPTQGTFTAVVRGTDLTGTVQFSTINGTQPEGAAANTGSSGSSRIYYNGFELLGNAKGSYNPQASTISITFDADAEGQGQINYTINTSRETGQTQTVTTVAQGGVTTTTSVVTTNFGIVPVLLVDLFDSYYISGSAVCNVSDNRSTQKFKGTGDAQYQDLQFVPDRITPVVRRITVPISVSGSRLTDQALTFSTSVVRPPTIIVQ